MLKPISVGTIVYSIAGRDQGRFFLVTEIVDDVYVRLADGDLRRIDTPKLKKIKHLRVEDAFLEKIAEKLQTGKKVFDAEIRSALRSYNAGL